MSRVVLLDATPLGDLCRPDRTDEIAAWDEALTAAGTCVAIPEIADYEVRRELLRAGRTRSVARLDALEADHTYIAITTPMMVLAAQVWAEARNSGRPGARRESLDGDVILVAQALRIRAQGHQVIVATSNVRHLSAYVDALEWRDIPVEEKD